MKFMQDFWKIRRHTYGLLARQCRLQEVLFIQMQCEWYPLKLCRKEALLTYPDHLPSNHLESLAKIPEQCLSTWVRKDPGKKLPLPLLSYLASPFLLLYLLFPLIENSSPAFLLIPTLSFPYHQDMQVLIILHCWEFRVCLPQIL